MPHSAPKSDHPPVAHTGSHDGSTAIAVDSMHFWMAEDEANELKMFSRTRSGPLLAKFDMNAVLGLSGKEVDIEGSCASPQHSGRIYWIGSLSNNKEGKIRPDRDRIFATEFSGSGAQSQLRFVGYYQGLRQHLIAWGDAQGYDFSAKAAKGVEPKRDDGFNVEGLEMAPDGKTLYIAFRAPLVGKRSDLALIAPLLDFEKWFASGRPLDAPRFGKPLELDLGGRGFRSLGKNAQGEFLIVAGSTESTPDFALYTWDGKATGKPRLRTANLQGLAPEGIVEVPASLQGNFEVQLLSDFGENKNTQSAWVQVQ